MGRPVEYGDHILRAAWEYIEDSSKDEGKVPTKQRLAWKLGSSLKTIDNWADRFPAFKEALDALMTLQGALLQEKGLGKETEPSITRLMLSANHGMSEKRHEDTTLKIVNLSLLLDASALSTQLPPPLQSEVVAEIFEPPRSLPSLPLPHA
ncbi:MAG: terminase [Siphoviridae sp. ctpQM7]|nr:MAG: terminase [Siphoviridae sp. ctpQM7]